MIDPCLCCFPGVFRFRKMWKFWSKYQISRSELNPYKFCNMLTIQRLKLERISFGMFVSILSRRQRNRRYNDSIIKFGILITMDKSVLKEKELNKKFRKSCSVTIWNERHVGDVDSIYKRYYLNSVYKGFRYSTVRD